MNERKPGFIDGFTRADDTLLDISKSLVDIRDLITKREDRDIKIYFFLIPNDGGERTFAVGTTEIDFRQGIITNPNNTKEILKSGLNKYANSDWLHSLSIRSNQDIKYRIQAFDTRTLYANYAARIPYITYDTLSITCTASTEISIFACTNPSAVIDEFSITVMQAMEQISVKHEATEAQTWDATLTSLVSNLNRIRHQIITIAGAAWGSASAALLKSTYNANTIIKADSDNTPIALTLAEQRILGRITGGSITGLTAAQIRTLINVADGANIYPGAGEQAFLDADHTKLDAIAANATKYPDTGEQAFLDADHTKLNGVEDSATIDQTGAEIKALYEVEANAFTDTKNTKLSGIATAATKYPDTGEQAFLDADHTKLNGIATAATKYPDTGEQAFLDADHTKLNGIEATADITDAINVASTIHGVAAKTTPVNADEVGIVDSAAANILKKLTWTNIKATLKTYFDTLYTKYPDTGEQAFLDADHTKLDAIAANATKYPDTGEQAFLDADHTKLNGIATAATKYPDTGEQAFLDADHTKLNGIETSATTDLTGLEIVALLEALAAASRLSHTKLDDIGASDHHAKYTNAEAVTAVATADDYIKNDNDDTLTGQLTITHNTASKPLLVLTRAAATQLFLMEYPTTGMEVFLEAGSSIGLFGTKSQHDLHIRTNYVTRIEIDKDGVDMDVKGMVIKNVADPVDNQDVCTKAFMIANKYPGAGEQAFLDADHTKLNGIETSATQDQTKADIDALGIDHGSLSGRTDDDHSQYYNSTRHTKAIHDALGIAPASHGADKHTDRPGTIFTGPGFTTGELSSMNDYVIVKLDPSIDEKVEFVFQIPKDYVSGGTLKIIYQEPAANNGTVIWDLVARSRAIGEATNTGSSSDVGNSLAVGAERKIQSVTADGISLTYAIDDFVAVELMRDADNGSDNQSEDWWVNGILFEYTADQ